MSCCSASRRPLGDFGGLLCAWVVASASSKQRAVLTRAGPMLLSEEGKRPPDDDQERGRSGVQRSQMLEGV
eukprot:111770-Alexandrium_andersonii.AAC.1